VTYRMESAKPAIMKFGYSVDYDKEILNDERQIAYLSSDFAKSVSAWVDGQRASGWQPTDVSDVLVGAPWIFGETLGLVTDDLRAMWVYLSSECDPEKIAKDPFGPEQPGDYRRGSQLMAMPVFFPLDADTWHDWRCMGEASRKESLRLAKAAISRHRRNKAKHHG
jgi:hypothetical protein